MVETTKHTVRIANSFGMDQTYTENFCNLYCNANVKEGDNVSTGGFVQISRDFDALDPDRLARDSVDQAAKVVHNKGGLYNRLTEQIHLQTFTLKECEEYVQAEGLVLNREQILQYYMIFGGVPYYWGFLKKGYSLAQNIDRILFEAQAPLKEEFKYLYASVFKKPEAYVKIIETLGQKKAGMTREELISASGIQNSGDLTSKLEELESCGFIRRYFAFGMKKKNAVYQLIDCFTLFYFKFLKNPPTDEHFWSNQLNTPAVNTWMGLAFERAKP